GAAAGLSFPREFPPAVSRVQHHRFLASLAHYVITMVARLSLHSAGRQPPRFTDDLSQPDAYHAAGRLVARSQLEFRDLGRLSRSAARPGARAGPQAISGIATLAAVSVSRRDHICSSLHR